MLRNVIGVLGVEGSKIEGNKVSSFKISTVWNPLEEFI